MRGFSHTPIQPLEPSRLAVRIHERRRPVAASRKNKRFWIWLAVKES
jgi:hypothetical protein